MCLNFSCHFLVYLFGTDPASAGKGLECMFILRVHIAGCGIWDMGFCLRECTLHWLLWCIPRSLVHWLWCEGMMRSVPIRFVYGIRDIELLDMELLDRLFCISLVCRICV